jgi:peptide methionine sulfoxide reductase MsrA
VDFKKRSAENIKEIYLAGGCFGGTEKYMALIKGVVSTEVGYANGSTKNPTFEEVCHNNTGYLTYGLFNRRDFLV